MGGSRSTERPASKTDFSSFSRVRWSRAAQAGLVSVLGSVSCTEALEVGAHGSIAPVSIGAPPFPRAERSALGFAFSAPLPLLRARARKTSRRRQVGSDALRGGGNSSSSSSSSAVDRANGLSRFHGVAGEDRRQRLPAGKLAVSMDFGGGASKSRREGG
ncbi:unnamed protein product, partial [Scytosiphon promiscuus]